MIITLIAAHPIICLLAFIGFILFVNAMINEGRRINAPESKKPAVKGNSLNYSNVNDNVVSNRRYNF